MHSAGEPRSAVDQYYSFLERLDNTTLRPSEPIRSLYYYRFIQALADANQLEPSGEFEVKGAFTALAEAKYFKKDYLVNAQRWRNDSSFLNAWGRCLLKFGASVKEVETAREFFDRAAAAARRPSEIASNYFANGMLSLVKGDLTGAKEFLERASRESPRTHEVKNATGNLKNDLESEVEMWERVARVFGNRDIDQQYSALIQQLKTVDARDATKESSNNSLQLTAYSLRFAAASDSN
jgi:hypothetical protein